jgi:transposase
MTIKTIAKTYQVHRVTVSTWIKKWEQHGVQSLHDQPRSGRPSKLTPDEQTMAQQYIKEEPRSLTGVVERLTCPLIMRPVDMLGLSHINWRYDERQAIFRRADYSDFT